MRQFELGCPHYIIIKHVTSNSQTSSTVVLYMYNFIGLLGRGILGIVGYIGHTVTVITIVSCTGGLNKGRELMLISVIRLNGIPMAES